MKLYIVSFLDWLISLSILLLRFSGLLLNNIHTNESHRLEQVRISYEIRHCDLLSSE